MESRNIMIGNMQMIIPEYYQQVDSMPDDPAGSVPFMVKTGNAMCFVMAYSINAADAMPLDDAPIIDGIHGALGEDQGLIEVKHGDDWVYSIVKTLRQPSGVQYCLTFDKYYGETAIHMHGFFDENGATGMRDTMVYELCRRDGLVGADGDYFSGWMRDPYDENYTKGARMNLSEQEEYDEMFPGFPLSMCREFVRTVIGN